MLRCAVSRRRVLGRSTLALVATAGLLGGFAVPGAFAAGGGLGRPADLTVDGLVSPIGLAGNDVQFAWHVNDTRRGAVQQAYRIVVWHGSSTVWDSGRVPSADQAFVDYAGPALASASAYRWAVQTWAAEDAGPSPLATAATFETGLADHDWQASWIRRAPSPGDTTDQYTYPRKEFALSEAPIERARAYVSGDQQYELYVNGTRAGKGQAYSYPDAQYYETLDLTALVRSGANAIGLLTTWDGATKGHPAGEPGAILQVSVLHTDGQLELITTDGSWRVAKGAWLPGTQRDLEGDLVDYTENIDGRAVPIGWDQPGFDDHAWQPAEVLGRAGVAPWSHLVPVRTRIVEQPVAAKTLTRLSSGAVVADFGSVSAAVPAVAFHHGVSGTKIAMRAGYLLDPDGQVSSAHGTQHTDMSYSYIQRGGTESFHPFDYLAFRYFQIDDPGEVLTAGDVVALTRHTEVPDEQAATFTSSNPTVDAVFELGRHSALFTAQEQFLDTPTREKGPWLWDGFNESQTAMAAFGEQNLTRKSLLEFAQSQSRFWPQGRMNKIYPTGLGALDIAEFTEIYPEWVWQYWMHTGDRTLLAEVYPVLTNIATYVHAAITPSTGLVTNLPATNIYSSLPVLTRHNVLAVDVFRRAADAGAVLGRPVAEVAGQRQRADALTAAINRHLTRADGTYVTGLNPDGSQTADASQDSNTVAVAYGVVPAAHLAAVASHIAGLGMSSAPRTAAELLQSLRLAGRYDDVLRRLTDPTTDGWAAILAKGATFTWEVWHPSDLIGDSMSHGWGANVLVEIQAAELGVTATSPGYATFAVAPPPTGLSWATGRVPTPRGSVSVAWHRPDPATAAADGAAFTLDLTVPANAAATVQIPAGAASWVTERGLSLAEVSGVRVVSMDGNNAILAVGSGTYHLRSSPADAGGDSTNGWALLLIVVSLTALVIAGGLILTRRRS